MAENARPRVRVAKTASPGEIVTIKALISHIMESGQRKDEEGQTIPRSIIHRFTCDFNGVNVIDIELHPAISANPYFEFDALVEESGEFLFTWHDDDGDIYTETAAIDVG